MGQSNPNVDDDLNFKKYGVPLYGAAWVPPVSTTKDDKANADNDSPPISAVNHLVLSGGGGEGRSGIPNALLVSKFDFDSNSLPDSPVAKLGTGSELPYRISVHPKGEGLICSLPQSCRWFEWDTVKNEDESSLRLKPSEKVLKQLEDVGQQLALTFNNEGSLLAVGGEDGKLRIFKWPSMDIVLDEANAHRSVKDLDFSPDGKYLASVGSGPARVWDVEALKSTTSLSKEKDELFGFCRFSRTSDENQVLYVTVMQDRGGSIVKYNTTSWKRLSSKHLTRDPISAFNVSDDGKFLAVGTIQGDVLIVSCASMREHTLIRKAHLGLVTTLKFSNDSRALLSTSLDSSVRVTIIKDQKENGSSSWIIILVILVAVAVYYARLEGIIP